MKALLAAICIACAALPLRAQSIIRDSEIEAGFGQLLAPILSASGLSRNLRVIVLNDPAMNAFVIDARTIFVSSGLIMALDRPAQLQAVLAHEAAHIANGHLARRPENADISGGAARMGLLLGLLTAASGNAQAGLGIATGTVSSAQRMFFAHTRSEESSADSAAMRYLVNAGIDPAAMGEVLDLFAGQEALSVGRQDAYVRTHPLTRDRLRAVDDFVARAGAAPQTDPQAQYWFDRARGKMTAFLQSPSWTLDRVGQDPSEIATMRRAIAYHRNAQGTQALAEMDRLLALRPDDPWYTELHGQILFENRRYDAAIAAYRAAVDLAPTSPLVLAGYGRALLAKDRGPENAQALEVLEAAFARDRQDPRLLRDLATAYARMGNEAMAATASAERALIEGDMGNARMLANRAIGLSPVGSSGWLRAQDVLRVAEAALNQRNRR